MGEEGATDVNAFQENNICVDLVFDARNLAIGWCNQLGALHEQSAVGNLVFADVTHVMQKIFKDLNGIVARMMNCKKKYGLQVKQRMEIIKAPQSTLGPYSNPEPPMVISVLEEGGGGGGATQQPTSKKRRRRRTTTTVVVGNQTCVGRPPPDVEQKDIEEQEELLNRLLQEELATVQQQQA